MATFDINHLFNVKDMVFVITGGGSGLGEIMASALDANGASKVFILGRREASLKKVAENAANKTIIAVICDVTSKDSLSAAAAFIEKESAFVNAVIANSGAVGPLTSMPPRSADATIADIQQQLWDTSFAESEAPLSTNVLGSFYTFLAFLELLEAGNTNADSRGKKDFIQSFSRMETAGYPYMASKAGLWHLTKSLATQFAKLGIRANSIAPGLYITEMTELMAGGKDLSIPGSLPVDLIPMTRTGSKEDIAGAILFLCSRAGAFVNGNVILSDGGTVAIQPASY
ncbi:short chain dehydrogenase/reductase family [Exophiala viscosa]|uniref:short chain dehydrogenase/reductase family n=1 Tax=Exophiala viscosa TaxID=2486360 RepID=UPI002197D136|nr:short chain dehydrogenase/reductase family [Exophiala viscosa]